MEQLPSHKCRGARTQLELSPSGDVSCNQTRTNLSDKIYVVYVVERPRPHDCAKAPRVLTGHKALRLGLSTVRYCLAMWKLNAFYQPQNRTHRVAKPLPINTYFRPRTYGSVGLETHNLVSVKANDSHRFLTAADGSLGLVHV